MNPTGKLLLAALLLCIILDSVCIHGVAEGTDGNAMRIETWEIDRHGTIYAYVPEILPEDRKVPMVLAMNCTTGNPQAEVKTNGWDRLCAEEGSVDWVLLYYVGTVVLNMSEDVFWKSTLGKLHAVFRCHCEHMPKASGKK